MTATDLRPGAAGAVHPARSRLRAVVVHCWTGTPVSGWYPALARELEDIGLDVCVPALPDSDDPDPLAWQAALKTAIDETATSLLLIGHSLGALAVLRWLVSAPAPVAGAILVAPPIGPSAHAVIARFAIPDDELHVSLARARRTLVVVSEADPYLQPSPDAVAAAFERAGAERLLVPGKGHFSPASGLKQLPEILPFVNEILGSGGREHQPSRGEH